MSAELEALPGSSTVADTGEVVIPVLLTRGFHALVSERDYDRVMTRTWRAHTDPRDGQTYATSWVKDRRSYIYMHRFILGITDPLVKVDHADTVGLHNYRTNLRDSSNTQNIRNQKPHRDKKTAKLKGVYFSAARKRFVAQIEVNRKKIYLGGFASEEAAGEAYYAAARHHFGEFARCNFPLAPQSESPSLATTPFVGDGALSQTPGTSEVSHG